MKVKIGLSIFIGLLAVAVVATFVGNYEEDRGYKTGYDDGYIEGEMSGLVQNIRANELVESWVTKYDEPVDIELRLVEKLIDAMSRAQMDLVIEDGDIISGRIHIYWEKD